MLTRLYKTFAFLIISLFGLALVGCGESEDNKNQSNIIRPVKTVIIAATSTSFSRSYPATVLPSQQVDLSFRVSGRIINLPIKSSQNVKKGDVIAQLDIRDFEAEVSRLKSQISQAKAQLSGMTAGARKEDIASLKAKINADVAKVKAARNQFERTQTLFKKGVVTKTKLDQDRANLSVAEADLKTSRQELIKGRAGSRSEEVEAQEASIKGLESQLKTARDNLSDATLKAPFDGTIAKREVENFSNIQAKDTIATLQDLGTLDVTFDVPAPDVTVLAENDKNLISFVRLNNIPNKEFEAKLVEFSTKADEATQTYRGRVSFTPPKGMAILSGMAGTIMIRQKETSSLSQINLPLSAIASDPNGKPFVWVVVPKENKVEKRPVKTGEAAGSNIVVLDGLKIGETVVTAGVSQLQPGMIVRPISKIGD
jgi:RND family efflux transporter MFP subunit